MTTNTLSHIDQHGQASMVDIANKTETERIAMAEARVAMPQAAWDALLNAEVTKGDVLATARIAGIMAAKNTAHLIPLCHSLGLSHISIDFDTTNPCVLEIRTSAKTTARTGVEMEAMTAASVAALTVYDMLKAIEKGISISSIRLLQKSGGKSGLWICS